MNLEKLKKCLKKYDSKSVTLTKRATLSERLKVMIPDAAILGRVLKEMIERKE